MQLSGFFGGFHLISLWVMRIAYINLLWVLFTFMGLILFGIMPASTATLTVIRKWLMKESDIPVFQTFFESFKKDFFKTNLMGLIILVIGTLLYIDLRYVGSIEGSSFYPILLGILFIAGVVYTILVLYIIPVYVHYELTFLQYIKYAIMIGATCLHHTIMMAVILAAVYYLYMKAPGLMVFFGVGPAGVVIMWSTKLAFSFLARKRENLLQQESEVPKV